MKSRMLLIPMLLLISGAICKAGVNLLEKQVFPFTNPSFEENENGWFRVSPKPKETPNVEFSLERDASDGETSFAITIHNRTWGYLPRAFQVEKGKKYYLCAKVKTLGRITGCLRVVYGAIGEPYSNVIGYDSGTWQDVSVTFVGGRHIYGYGEPKNPDPNISYCELRLEAKGSGTVYFDDIRVYELKEYAPFIRVKLLEPAGVKYKLKLHGLYGAPKYYYTAYFFQKEPVPSGQWSPWINLGELEEFKGRGVVFTGICFETSSGGRFSEIKALIQFAAMPDESGIVREYQRSTPGDTIGVIIPKSENTPVDFLAGFKPLEDDIEMRNQHAKSLNLPPCDLKKYYVETHLKGFGAVYTDTALVEKEVNTIRTLGFNALDTGYSGLSGAYRLAAAKEGIFQTHNTFRMSTLPKDPATKNILCDWDKIREAAAKFMDTNIEHMKKNDPGEIPLIKFVDAGDEIAGEVFGGIEFEKDYREYLKSRGLKPADFKKKTWDEVKPYGCWWWSESWNKRPTDRTAIDSCISYYWTLRHWNWATARVYRILTEEIERRMPGVLVRVNFGPPWAYGYCTYMRGAEIWEFARQNSVTSFWNEDWLNTSGWRNAGIQMVSYLVDLSRSCARINNAEVCAFVMPGSQEQIQLKLASVIGKGAKRLDLYRYGPQYYSPDYWSSSLPMAEGVAKFLRKLEKAEDVIYPGKPPKADVAILWSASDPVWNECDAELWDNQLIYLALLHKQIPVDFVDEFAVENGALANYKVVVLSARYLRKATLMALAQWVRNGGNLWADGLTGTGDEYGQKTADFLPVLGIKDVIITDSTLKRSFNPQNGVYKEIIPGTFIWKTTGEEIQCIGRKISFSISDPENVKVLAMYPDGKIAAIEHRYGKGRVFYIGTYAGLCYNIPVVREPGRIETNYRETERKLVTDFVLQSGVSHPVASSIDCVQADILESDAGTGIVLANYTGTKQEKITLTIRAGKRPSKVTSVECGDLKFSWDETKKAVVVSLPLDICDIILVR